MQMPKTNNLIHESSLDVKLYLFKQLNKLFNVLEI